MRGVVKSGCHRLGPVLTYAKQEYVRSMRKLTDSPRLFVARSKIHGLGLFAGEDIEWGRRVIQYRGEPLSLKEAKRRQRFYDSIGFTCLIQFGDGLGIDGISGGNESRFINHSDKPNLGAIRETKWHIVFYSLDDISEGDELTFNYGFDPKKTSIVRVANRNRD